MDVLLDCDKCSRDKRYHVLIIYDIVSDVRRRKLVKYLRGYGFRVQKSAFEAKIEKRLYKKLLAELPRYVSDADNIRVYRLGDDKDVVNYGVDYHIDMDQLIIV